MSRRFSLGRFLAKLLVWSIVLTMLTACGAYLYLKSMLEDMDQVEMSQDQVELGITQDTYTSEDVMNIALFGIDSREADGNTGRSDAMIVLSIDKEHKKIKLHGQD